MTEPGVGHAEAAAAEALLRVARAIGDPVRLEILRLLAHCCMAETPCATLRESLPVAAPTLSHHMKELKDAGLVLERRDGRTVGYVLNHEAVRAFLETVAAQLLVSPTR